MSTCRTSTPRASSSGRTELISCTDPLVPTALAALPYPWDLSDPSARRDALNGGQWTRAAGQALAALRWPSTFWRARRTRRTGGFQTVPRVLVRAGAERQAAHADVGGRLDRRHSRLVGERFKTRRPCSARNGSTLRRRGRRIGRFWVSASVHRMADDLIGWLRQAMRGTGCPGSSGVAGPAQGRRSAPALAPGTVAIRAILDLGRSRREGLLRTDRRRCDRSRRDHRQERTAFDG